MVRRLATSFADPFACHEIPIVAATPESLKGYGYLVDDFATAKIEIVRWPAQGWRPVDPDTGDEGGTTEGHFSFEWKGDVLFGRNDAVNDSYLIGWTRDPREASEAAETTDRDLLRLREKLERTCRCSIAELAKIAETWEP